MGRVSKRNTSVHKNSLQSIRLYKVGIYARLSSEQDDRKNESVDMQIEIAKQFVERNNEKGEECFIIADTYCDFGKTGTNFNRDAFARMMQDIRLGDVNCVIVKDLSRFGRNYLETGNYLEKIFPFLGVRFIAITDGVDTGADGSNNHSMATEIRNLVNDTYAKDFSVKAKLQLQQRREQGSYVGGPPPYGYDSTWEQNVRKLIPDENTRGVVKFIFDAFIQMKTYKAVTDKINQQRINPPSIYKKTKETYCPVDSVFYGWDTGSVARILKNPVYIGNLEQGKTSITARNEASRVKKNKTDWVRKERTHEPLIEMKIFKSAEKIVEEKRKHTMAYQHQSDSCPIEENIFDSVLFCGICKKKMTRESHVKVCKNGNQTRLDSYFCSNGTSSKVHFCSGKNRITKSVLSDILLKSLKTEFAVYLDKPKKYIDYGYGLLGKARKNYDKQLQKVQKEGDSIECVGCESYMEYKSGIISQSAYVELKRIQASKIKKLEDAEAEIEACRENMDRRSNQFIKEIRSLIKPETSTKLTKDLVDSWIERINLYPEKRVEIIFRYSDEMPKGVNV